MKSKGSYNAKLIDLENRHDEYMRKKYELKKINNGKTGTVKEENSYDICDNGGREREEME